LAKFGNTSVLSLFNSYGIDVIQSVQSINSFQDVTISPGYLE